MTEAHRTVTIRITATDGDFQDTKGRVVDDLQEIKRELNTLAGQQARLQAASAAYTRQQYAAAQQLQQTTQTTRRHLNETREAVDISEALERNSAETSRWDGLLTHLQGRLRETEIIRRRIEENRARQTQDTSQTEVINQERQALEKLVQQKRIEADEERKAILLTADTAERRGREKPPRSYAPEPRGDTRNASSPSSRNWPSRPAAHHHRKRIQRTPTAAGAKATRDPSSASMN